MASPSELSLECKPHSYSMLLKSFGEVHHQSSDQHQNQNQNQTYKLEEFLSRLEEERLKIDAFKRELPLCMQLLTNAMEASRQQLQAFRVNQQQGGTAAIRPVVLEEFIPIKHSNCSSDQISSSLSDHHKAQNMSDNKANWMTSAQLWSQTSEAATKQQQQQQQQPTLTSSSPKQSHNSLHHHHHDIGFNVSPKLVLENKHRNGGFLPFSKESRSPTSNSSLRGLPELALASPEKEMMILDNDNNKKCAGEITENIITGHNNNKMGNSSGNNNNNNDGVVVVVDQGKGASPVASSHAQTSTATTTTTTTCTNTTQTHRKARRCWSPDLHRRFVNALQMLGGSQVATPKQIRELMKVDGLTNDEVKSHLQKYRLHTRRPSPSPQAGAPAPQLVVLGGIWVPPEYATAAAAAPALYGAHHPAPPPHYCAATPVPQEFYTVAPPQPLLPPPPPPHHNGSLHHHLHVYKAAAGHGQSSPESEVGGGGERSESIEDGKSESSSWKGESEGGKGSMKKAMGVTSLSNSSFC